MLWFIQENDLALIIAVVLTAIAAIAGIIYVAWCLPMQP
jgi:hypothetical protein